MKPAVLFVDDEPRVLDAIRRCGRSHRNQWDIAVATSGEAALAHMREVHVDALVTDMRMPEMDGVELLRHVSRDHPTTMRVVLSGQTDFGAAIVSVALAHQLLGKPCAPNVVMETVDRMHACVSTLEDPRARDAVVALTTLPSSPAALEQLDRSLPNEDARALGDIIASDAAMSAKMLQVAQSSFFGATARNATIDDAVRLVGVPAVRVLRKHAFECQTWRASHETLSSDAPLASRVGALVRDVTEGVQAIPIEHLGTVLLRMWGVGV